MSDRDSRLQGLIDRLRANDASARSELVEHAYRQLCRLAAGLQRSFPILKGHEPESIVHTAWERLMRAIDQSQPPTVTDLFRLSSHVIHRVLLDMAEHHRKLLIREGVRLSTGGEDESARLRTYHSADDSNDAARLAVWCEFHDQVARLPQRERDVFEMHYYLDVTQAEIARLLDTHPRTISRLWIAATELLADHVPEISRFF